MMPFPITDSCLGHLQTGNLGHATVYFKLHVVVQYLLGKKRSLLFGMYLYFVRQKARSHLLRKSPPQKYNRKQNTCSNSSYDFRYSVANFIEQKKDNRDIFFAFVLMHTTKFVKKKIS